MRNMLTTDFKYDLTTMSDLDQTSLTSIESDEMKEDNPRVELRLSNKYTPFFYIYLPIFRFK